MMSLELQLERRAVKRVRLEFGRDGLLVIVPHRFAGDLAPILQRHRRWIRARQKFWEQINRQAWPMEHRTEAEFNSLVQDLIDQSRLITNHGPKKLRYRQMLSRWGSCNNRGEITLNKRLRCLPDELVGYVVHHEMCHLLEMHHRPSFWSLVARRYPDYPTLKERLTIYQLLIK